MNIIRNTIVFTLLFLCPISGFGDNGRPDGPRGRHQGPPPEAYTACQGKSAGDTASFESPHGDTVTGTCELQGDRLVLRPDNPPEGEPGRRSENENSD